MLNKDKIFRKLYNSLLEGGSFTTFIGGVRIEYVNTTKFVKVNYGEELNIEISDEKPAYDACHKILEIADNPKYYVEEDFLKEVEDMIHNTSQNPEEKIFEIRDVPIHWIPNTKEFVVLSDNYLSVKLDHYYYDESASSEIASAIKNIELKRENSDYVRREAIVREKRTQFFDKLTEFESRPKDSNVLIIERKDLGEGITLLVLVDKDYHDFSIVTFKGDVVLKSSKRYYNNPSTINFLAWDYVSCSEL